MSELRQARIPWSELSLVTWDDEDRRDILVMVNPEIAEGMDLMPLSEALFGHMGYPAGVGLAAPQIGIHARAVAVRYQGHKQFLANPVFRPVGDESEIANEGCLSFPGRHVPVRRYARGVVSGMGPTWREKSFQVSGHLARIYQHEIDHLDGITMMDRSGHWRRTENNQIITEH